MSNRHIGESGLSRDMLRNLPNDWAPGETIPVDIDEIVLWARQVDRIYQGWEQTIEDFDEVIDELDEAEKLIEKLQKGE